MHKFSLHDLIVVTDSIDIGSCNTIIEKGERGKIVDVDPETKDLCIRLSSHHPDLHCRRNIIALSAAEASGKIKRDRAKTGQGCAHALIGSGVFAILLLLGLQWIEQDNLIITATGASHHHALKSAVAPLAPAKRDILRGVHSRAIAI